MCPVIIHTLDTRDTLTGTNVLRDFVELPSQLMEHWMEQVYTRWCEHRVSTLHEMYSKEDSLTLLIRPAPKQTK